ncbi:SDR family oxidoreductase [Streptomyces sp. ME02-8801-2C]|uniref:SDR family oxidoreductase n=1 Tax=Streptomyces sp. ME02-8801-2C TaxID=3028680 RepID=UPI0029BAA5BF|nr:SDR family oxidoreductase [Streptomyces sp. ME02-8801-2C]MDX3451902.1 SDR family oxidoreductase [Streptomyces sp. ME02-8801-2C]
MTSPYGLEGRVALVTGGTRGIGLAVTAALVRAGARVCVTARDPDGVRRAAEELSGIGLAGDVADPAHLLALTEFTLDAFGRLDILVNNAATNQPYGQLMDADPDLWREAFTLNVEAPLRLTQCAWRAWMREHGGTVINICTEGATHVGPNVGAYGTSKAALLHLTQQLAGELAPRVRVNSVSPGLVRTEMARFVWEHTENPGLPLGRIGEPEDIANAVLWLASDAANWVTGTDLLVDGGTRVRPALRAETSPVHEHLRRHEPTEGRGELRDQPPPGPQPHHRTPDYHLPGA